MTPYHQGQHLPMKFNVFIGPLTNGGEDARVLAHVNDTQTTKNFSASPGPLHYMSGITRETNRDLLVTACTRTNLDIIHAQN